MPMELTTLESNINIQQKIS